MRKRILLMFFAGILSMALCGFDNDSAAKDDLVNELGLNAESKEASQYTAEINSAVYGLLDFSDTQEAEFAVQGLIAAPETLELKNEEGKVIWSQDAYAFLDDYETAPDTVNPSLWENTKNNHTYGLFEVMDGIYQVRGYDMANLTVVEGDNSWIVFDTTMGVECAQAAMQLINENLGERPVSAVIISHSHIDHFGGIRGIINEEDVADASLSLEEQIASGKIPVIVPEGFESHAVSENLYAGPAMGRRASYQYGVYLDKSPTGAMAIGIGMGQSTGQVSYISPTYEVKETGETCVVDGVEMEFQITPGTEAPAEMNTWLPQKKALWMAENCTGTLHNLYTLRGAEVRDGSAWADYICEALKLYGDEAEVTFQSHNWPHWGNDTVRKYMLNTASIYKYINDQTLTYICQGYTSDEISNMIQLPEEMEKIWCTRQYYGTVAHNAKAVYQKYIGWYDANPVNLDPLTPEESAKKWVEYMELDGVDDVLRQAKKDFDKGEYQWVAEVTNTIVFADPENEAARLLCADALEQLGYQSESGTWRNAYLTGVLELRSGNASLNAASADNSGDIVRNMSVENIFDYMDILLDKKALSSEGFSIQFIITDTKDQTMIQLVNGVILQFKDYKSDDVDLTVTTVKNGLLYLLQGNTDEFAKISTMEGDTSVLEKLTDNLTEESTKQFNIIEP